jgi:hypothetical protein
MSAVGLLISVVDFLLSTVGSISTELLQTCLSESLQASPNSKLNLLPGLPLALTLALTLTLTERLQVALNALLDADSQVGWD